MSDNATCLASVFPLSHSPIPPFAYLHVLKSRGKNSHRPIASTQFFATLIAGVCVQFSTVSIHIIKNLLF